jgi:hypothetical protein
MPRVVSMVWAVPTSTTLRRSLAMYWSRVLSATWEPCAHAAASSALRRTTAPGCPSRQASSRNSVGVRRLVADGPSSACVAGSSVRSPGLHRCRRAGPAQRHLEPGDELGEMERLGQVVVPADGEPGQPVRDAASRGQEQHGGADPCGSHGLADVSAVSVRKPDVEHDCVDVGVHRAHRPGPVGGGDDLVAVLPQTASEDVSKAMIVLHDQHPKRHVLMVRFAGVGSRCWRP